MQQAVASASELLKPSLIVRESSAEGRSIAFSRGPTGTGPVETWFRLQFGLAFNRAPTDAGSNGTRLTAKCSAFFSSGSGHVGKFSKSVFELPRFEAVGTNIG